MDKLELKKLKVELLRIDAVVGDRELAIEEKLSEIERIKDHINLQMIRREEIQNKINSHGGDNK